MSNEIIGELTQSGGMIIGEISGMTYQSVENELTALSGRLDTIITTPAGSVSAQEIIDARGGKPTLGAKLIELDVQTAQNTSQQSRNAKNIAQKAAMGSHFSQTVRPLVTIIDDDGTSAVLTKLKPLALEFNIPVGVSLSGISDVIVDPIKRAEILNLQNNNKWEILSHTYNHVDMSALTPAQIEDDCKNSLELFNGFGFDVFNIVYPYSLPSPAIAKICSKYYSAGFGTLSNYNLIYNIDEYNVYRVAIGSFMSTTYDTLDKFKALVDAVKLNKGWLVLMTHVAPTDPVGITLIRDVISYIIAQGVEIVSPTEGLRAFGSVAQSGMKSENHFHVKSGGIVETNTYVMIKRTTKLEADAPGLDMGAPQIQYFQVSGWTVGDGLVTEYVASSGYQYQEFRKTGTTPVIYIRKWTGTLWKTWQKYAFAVDRFMITVTARTIPANSTVDIITFDAGALAVHYYVPRPVGTPESGITWSAWSHGDGAYILRLSNSKSTDVTIAERVWYVSRIVV